jgi:hypothetical protein
MAAGTAERSRSDAVHLELLVLRLDLRRKAWQQELAPLREGRQLHLVIQGSHWARVSAAVQFRVVQMGGRSLSVCDSCFRLLSTAEHDEHVRQKDSHNPK